MKLPPVLLFAAFVLAGFPAIAGPGHEHPPEPGQQGAPGGSVTLSEVQRRNLGLETTEATIIDLAPTVTVPAVLILPPDRHARITAPFPGRVTQLLAKLGDHVEKDQPVLRVTPLTVGSPPQDLRAPLDGVIFDQAAVVGTAFEPQTSLMETGDYRELLARGVLYQSPDLSRIRTGQPVELTLDIFPDENFAGVVQRVDPGHTADSPFFHVYATVANPDDHLHPNYRARMTIRVGEPQAVVVIPRRAVLGGLGKLFVFTENEPGLYERREVITGLKSGELIEVVEGVLPGDQVVTTGNYQLQYVLPDAGGSALDSDHGHPH